jgi:guanylate kinase
VGKGTVVNHIKQHHPHVHLSISATTRDPRPGEIDGVNYYFIDHGEFDAMIYSEALLEWAEVHGQNKYGTPRGPIENALSEGKSVLFEIDLQGARQIRSSMPEARLVFLLPPDWDELVRRLRERGTESEEEIERRLHTAYGELAAKDEFDVRVINRDVSEAAQQVVDLMGLNKE